MSHLETLLRETFRAHEGERPDVSGLAARARSRAARDRRRDRLVGTAAGVAVLLVVFSGVRVVATSRTDQPNLEGQRWPVVTPAGWQVVSSLGVEVSVPPSWVINDEGSHEACQQRASVFRSQTIDLQVLCSPNPTVSRVTITSYVPPSRADSQEPIEDKRPVDVHVRPVQVSGRTASVGTGRMPDGRAFLTVAIPSVHASVIAVGPDAALLDRILRTVRAVTVDDVGCSTALPPAPSWDHPAGGPRVTVGTPNSVAVCYYHQGTLAASTRLAGRGAADLAAAVNSAAAGVARVRPQYCPSPSEGFVLRLRLTYPTGAPVDLIAHDPDLCGDWYVASPHAVSQLGAAILKATLAPLQVGYGVYRGIPGYPE